MFHRIDITPRLLIGVMFVLWIVGCSMTYNLFVKPKVKRFNTFKTKITAAQHALTMQNQRQSEIKTNCQRLETLVTHLKLKTRHFPIPDDLSQRVRSVANVIARSGLTLEQFTPIAFNKHVKTNRLPFNLEMTGTYSHFVLLLNRLSQMPGVVMMQHLLIARGLDNPSKLKIQLIIHFMLRPSTIGHWVFDRDCNKPSANESVPSLHKNSKRAYPLKLAAKNPFINSTDRMQKTTIEQYPVAAMKFVGIMKTKSRTVALVQLPDGSVQSVMAGQHLGNNHGVVHHITKHALQLIDAVQGIITLSLNNFKD